LTWAGAHESEPRKPRATDDLGVLNSPKNCKKNFKLYLIIFKLNLVDYFKKIDYNKI